MNFYPLMRLLILIHRFLCKHELSVTCHSISARVNIFTANIFALCQCNNTVLSSFTDGLVVSFAVTSVVGAVVSLQLLLSLWCLGSLCFFTLETMLQSSFSAYCAASEFFKDLFTDTVTFIILFSVFAELFIVPNGTSLYVLLSVLESSFAYE